MFEESNVQCLKVFLMALGILITLAWVFFIDEICVTKYVHTEFEGCLNLFWIGMFLYVIILHSFWQKDSLITHILFELCLFRYLAQSTYLRDTLYHKYLQCAAEKIFSLLLFKPIFWLSCFESKSMMSSQNLYTPLIMSTNAAMWLETRYVVNNNVWKHG